MSIYTFNDKHKKYQLSVQTEFLTKCPTPEQYDVFELNSKYFLFTYLHNPNAPAVIKFMPNTSINWEQFWLEGKLIGSNKAKLIELDSPDLLPDQKVLVNTDNTTFIPLDYISDNDLYEKILHSYKFNSRLQNQLE